MIGTCIVVAVLSLTMVGFYFALYRSKGRR
jgi:hypothetical protein